MVSYVPNFGTHTNEVGRFLLMLEANKEFYLNMIVNFDNNTFSITRNKRLECNYCTCF